MEARELHTRLVEQAAERLREGGGADVRPTAGGGDRPDAFYDPLRLRWRQPDVVAYEDGRPRAIVLVHTGDTLDDAATEDAWRFFTTRAIDVSARLIVAVPRGFGLEAETRAKVFRVPITIWEL